MIAPARTLRDGSLSGPQGPMERKKTEMAQAKAAKPNVFARLIGYFRNVWAELKRVVWPSRNEVFNSSMVVIVTLLFFAAFTFILDQILLQVMTLIGSITVGG